MKRLKPFAFFEPASLAEAMDILAREGSGAYPLAGGTDLLVRMKRGDIRPAALVNLKRIAGLGAIARENGQGLGIGSLAPISEIEDSSLVRTTHPALGEAAGSLGSRSIRNLGTVGGNIGRASPASDMAPALIVLEARVRMQGPKGNREAEIDQFFKGPGATLLNPGELITSFFVPPMEAGSGAAYMRLGRREGMDCALVGAAVCLVLSGSDHGVKKARVALAAVGPIPLRAKSAEKVLLAGSFTEERMREAARAAMGDCFPITDMRASGEYRREMVGVMVRRSLEKVRDLVEGGRK